MTMPKYVAIAIDGPAGAGKTTQAKLLAKALGYTYVDTGGVLPCTAPWPCTKS